MSDEASALRDEVSLIRDVITYAHRFRGAVFVFRISSRVARHPRFPALVQDLALLHENGIGIAIVPSPGAKIDELLSLYAVATERVQGIRIATSEAMPLIQMAAFDTATAIMNQLARNKVEALIGNWVRARALGVREGIDYGDTGTIERIHADLIRRALEDGVVPILPCIGWNAVGKPYSISSLELATRLSVSLKAKKLFIVAEGEPFASEELQGPREGVEAAEGYISRISATAAEALITDWPQLLEPVELEFLQQAVAACRGGVERVHFLDGTLDGVILKEVFSSLGHAVMVHADPFENLRAMTSDDIPEVLRIMEPMIAAGVLVSRTQEDLERLCTDFVVYESDGTVRGCAALHRYGSDQAEIAGVAVDEGFGQLGIGQKLVRYLIGEASRLGLVRVFILTTQTADWFESLGFLRSSPEDLPEEKRRHYDERRKSRIYVFPLPPKA